MAELHSLVDREEDIEGIDANEVSSWGDFPLAARLRID